MLTQRFFEFLGERARDKRRLIDALEWRIEVSLNEDRLSWSLTLPLTDLSPTRKGMEKNPEGSESLAHRGARKLGERTERGDTEAAKHADELRHVPGPLSHARDAKPFSGRHGRVLERFNGEGGKETRRFPRAHNATRAGGEDRPERAIGNPYGAFPASEVGDGIDEGARECRLPSRVPRGPSSVKQERSR